MAADPVTLAIKVGLTALQMGLTALNKIEGPRLDNLEATTADYGTPIVRFWGKRKYAVPIIWAERLREKKVESKTKGGKYSEYKYFGTFAVLIADHAIDEVTRIWMDKHLVYDSTRAGPITAFGGLFSGLGNSPVKLSRGKNMRIYEGAQTAPDRRMEEWCEDRYGANSCPAYLDNSYIVFEELPLEKFGNRIPQIAVEAVRNKSDNRIYETLSLGGSGANGPFFNWSRDRALFYGITYSIWDVATRTKIVDGTLPSDTGTPAFDSAGRMWATTGVLGGTLRQLSPDGHQVVSECAVGTFGDKVYPIGGDIFVRPYNSVQTYIIQCSAISCSLTSVAFSPSMYFADTDQQPWAVGMVGTTIYLRDINAGDQWTFSSPSGVTGEHGAFFNHDGDIFVIVNTRAILIDRATMTISNSVDIGGSGPGHFSALQQVVPGAASFFTASKEVDAASLATLQTYALTDWTATDPNYQSYDPFTHSLWCRGNSGSSAVIRYLNRVTGNGTALSSIIDEVAEWCGASDVDVSDLDQTVPGYSVTPGSGKDMISPLMEIHDVVVRPHDFGIQFLKRGDASLGTLETANFVREGDDDRYRVTIQQDTDLPQRITLSFADKDKDQQTNTVVSQRYADAVDTKRVKQIDMTTYVSTAGDAQKLLDRYFRRQWNGRESIELSLTAQNLALEPGDTYNLDLDGVERFAMCRKATLSQGRLNTEWERDALSFATLSSGSGAEMEGKDDDELFVPGPTKAIVAEIPLLEDGHSVSEMPQLYYGAGEYAGSWPGAIIWTGEFEEDEYIAWNEVQSGDGAVWGHLESALPNVSPWVWDRGSSVVIQLKGGTLTSATEAQINADPTVNQALIGIDGRWEVVNFTTATLLGSDRWQVSGFRRGRRGTEGNVSSHAIGDEFWLASSLKRDQYGLSEVGETQYFRGQTVGRDPVGVAIMEIEQEGAVLKPYAPAQLKWVYNGTDLLGTIIRRTRLGGAWVGGTTIPLSENSEEYEVEIYNGATLKRTITVTGTNTFTYTAAMAAADSITLPTPPTTRTYQLSDEVGRGFALAA